MSDVPHIAKSDLHSLQIGSEGEFSEDEIERVPETGVVLQEEEDVAFPFLELRNAGDGREAIPIDTARLVHVECVAVDRTLDHFLERHRGDRLDCSTLGEVGVGCQG